MNPNLNDKPNACSYNGGQGASSLFGLLQEFGPLILDEADTDPRPNPWAWTKTHTVCAFDSPPPIGLSYCSDGGPGGAATSCGAWSDTKVG